MAKDETKVIQEYICNLGKMLGFQAEIEYSFGLFGDYEPRYDVVWFLDLPLFKHERLMKTYGNWEKLFYRHPIATFEIEGSTTSSKNQVANFTNVMVSPAMYSFIIVNNSAAAQENDTYRRGLKIYRTIKDAFGNRNIVFLDWSQIKCLTLPKIKSSDKTFTIPVNDQESRSSVGGEKQSVEIYNLFVNELFKDNYCIRQNYTPCYFEFMEEYYNQFKNINSDGENNYFVLGKKFINDPETKEIKEIKKFNNFYYLPKIDISININLPISFNIFLYALADSVGYDYVNYPLLAYIKRHSNKPIEYSLLGVEIETSVNKHMNGGIINCSRYSFAGLLISDFAGEKHLNMLKNNFGLSNVFYLNVNDLILDK